jgi:hypothetical protein
LIAQWKIDRGEQWLHHGRPSTMEGEGERPSPVPCWTVPVVARGKLYIRISDRLTCYDLMN